MVDLSSFLREWKEPTMQWAVFFVVLLVFLLWIQALGNHEWSWELLYASQRCTMLTDNVQGLSGWKTLRMLLVVVFLLGLVELTLDGLGPRNMKRAMKSVLKQVCDVWKLSMLVGTVPGLRIGLALLSK